MDNFCPCFCYPLIFKLNLLLLSRDAQARLTISSPLEAHKTNTIVFHMVGVDVGFENPLFACLEIDYEEADNDPSG
jgi:splicing factor 3B subunit 3